MDAMMKTHPFQFGSSFSRADCSQQALVDLFWVRALERHRGLSLSDKGRVVSGST